jgi:predicted acetyltransferase
LGFPPLSGIILIMAMQLRWVGESDLDRVAETRLRCYAKAAGDLEAFKLRTRADPRAKSGDYLLAEIDGQAVGTTTSISFTMWCRGGSIPCQGVAWVGAIKTMRRKGSAGTPGVASAVMRESLRLARERGDVVSALMPFRASYYEHFGYGVVERRCDWTVPIATLPIGEFDSIRFTEPGDFDARAELLRRVNRAGQCEIERSGAYWKKVDESAADGFSIVDRAGDGPVRGSMNFLHQQVDGKDLVKVSECIYEDAAGLRRMLHFLSSLKDQFAAVQLTLPADVPLNRMLSESQIPHRPVNHPVSRCHSYTRMQVRILDHAKFLQALNLPARAAGSAVVSVRECEGHTSRFKLEIDAGKIHCIPSEASPEIECPDRTWAAIACGDLKASDALRFGLANGSGASVLDALAMGPLPFTHEYF